MVSDLCMMCGLPALDAQEYGKQTHDKEETEFWVYCKACDCWTEHPIRREAVMQDGQYPGKSHKCEFHPSCPQCDAEDRNALLLQVSELQAQLDRLKRAVQCYVEMPMEKHIRTCGCSACDLDRAMLNSPDFKERDKGRLKRKGHCPVEHAMGNACELQAGHEGLHKSGGISWEYTLNPKDRAADEYGPLGVDDWN